MLKSLLIFLTKFICFANNPFTNEQICSPTLSLGKINGIPGILREWCFVKLKKLKYGNWIRLAMMSRVFTECNSIQSELNADATSFAAGT